MLPTSSSHTELCETDIVVITLFSVVSVVAVVLVLTIGGARDSAAPHVRRTASGRKRVLTRSTRQSSSSSSSSSTKSASSSQHTCTHSTTDHAVGFTVSHDTRGCSSAESTESDTRRVPRRRNIIRRVALTATGSVVGN